MRTIRGESITARERLTQGGAFLLIAAMVMLVLVGPRGLLAWREYNAQLESHQAQIKLLTAERDAVKNRVALVDPRRVDPDMAGELLRSELNVVHADEMVMLLN